VVAWQDNRRGLLNAQGNYVLDYYATYSTDGGQTWAPDFQVNGPDNFFDPDAVENPRDLPMNNSNVWIGEYFGLAVSNGTAYVAWNGNRFDPN
jgi:hypothetical protein